MIKALVQPLDPEDNHLEAEWRRLQMRTEASFFISWDWAGTLLASLPAKHQLLVLRLSEGAETVGLAYLGRERALRHLLVTSRRLHFNSPGEPAYNCLTTEDNLLIARPELESACWNAIMGWFAHEQKLADELILPGLRQPIDPTVMSRHRVNCDNIALQCFHVELNRLAATNGRFLDLLSKNARYQLRRSMRDYGGPSAIKLVVARSTEEALDWFENMKALHIDSWTRRGKPHSFSRPFFESFHKNLIRRTFDEGRIQMLRVAASGTPIGYLYNFRDGERTYAYQSGFADKDRRLRPGAVSHALAIEHNFRLGVHVYDFMAGSNRLKRSFATGCRDMHWITVQLPRMRFRLENKARSAKQRLVGSLGIK
jgi:CelD/BcsL family acetyltransferase involved in cellulose biosynthesis